MGWMPQPKDKDWLNGYKNKTPIYAVYKRPTSNQGTHTDWKWRAGKKIFHANGDQKKTGVAILISDKIDWNKDCEKRQRRHYLMVKGSIQEHVTIVKKYAPNIGAPQYIRQMLTSMKGEINSNTIILGTLIPHSHLGIDQPNRKLARKHRL